MNKSQDIHIRLAPEDKAMLIRIIEYKNTTASDLIRLWIQMMYSKLFVDTNIEQS